MSAPRSGRRDGVAGQRARHAARPAATAAELAAGDRHDGDPGPPQGGVGVVVALVGDDDTGGEREHVVAVVPLLALGFDAVAAGRQHLYGDAAESGPDRVE